MLKRGQIYKPLVAVILLVGGWGVVASANRRPPESDLAAPGAALYEKALTESVKSLMSKQEQAALDEQSRPPSPGPDYYWCENCKTYHKRQAPASSQQPTAQRPVATPPTTPLQPGAAAAARPPSPGPDYFWCANCKTYHKRQAVSDQQRAVKQGSPGTPVPQAVPAAAPGTAPRPPSPGEDYFWCENCKTYHRRQPAAQQPDAPQAHIAPPPVAGAGTLQASGDYYYCEDCKTYHRRQPIPEQPAGTSRIPGVSTNSPNQNPLIAP